MIDYGRAMFDHWSEYFFMVGSSAAALIGLMFVVVTLTAGRERSELEPGKKLYTSPIVWHLGVVLVLSGAAEMPPMTPRLFGIVCGLAAVIGLVAGIRITSGIVRVQLASNHTRYDAFWYGAVPVFVYVALGASAVALFEEMEGGLTAAALSIMALLLVSIHNEWDLVTFLAPTAQPPGSGQGGNSSS
jgi:hypothetical protein